MLRVGGLVILSYLYVSGLADEFYLLKLGLGGQYRMHKYDVHTNKYMFETKKRRGIDNSEPETFKRRCPATLFAILIMASCVSKETSIKAK